MTNQDYCWKIAYASKGEALQVAKRKKSDRGINRAYQCQNCGLFHLTSLKRDEPRKWR